jgi:hypothetical protein
MFPNDYMVNTTIRVKCDRCKKIIEGYFSPDCTGGYYIKTSYWGKFMKGKERSVCDKCMHEDPGYIKEYGSIKN